MKKCTRSSPLSDEMLGFALDGLADEETYQHLAECEFCSSRLRELRSMDEALQKRLRRYDCPSPQALADYDAEILDEAENASIAQHLKFCLPCQRELKLLQQFLGSEDENEVRPSNIIPLRLPKWVLPISQVRSDGTLALKGEQGPNGETQYDLTSGTARIFLELRRNPNGVMLSGQIVDSQNDWSGAIAQLLQDGEIQSISILDDICEFKFEIADSTSPVTLNIAAKNALVIVIEDLILPS